MGLRPRPELNLTLFTRPHQVVAKEVCLVVASWKEGMGEEGIFNVVRVSEVETERNFLGPRSSQVLNGTVPAAENCGRGLVALRR